MTWKDGRVKAGLTVEPRSLEEGAPGTSLLLRIDIDSLSSKYLS